MELPTRQVIVEGHLIPLGPIVKPVPPLIPVEPPPPVPKPYFSIGEVSGAPGSTVMVEVEAGCLTPITGFHIGGGVGLRPGERTGYGKFKAKGAHLGEYLRSYLKAEGVIHDSPGHQHEHYYSKFEFAQWDPDRALPEEWWEFFVGFFSLDQERTVPPTTIPSGTHLFTLGLEILATTAPGEYLLTMEDEHYYTQAHQRRRDFTWTNVHQGVTKIETRGGKLTVT